MDIIFGNTKQNSYGPISNPSLAGPSYQHGPTSDHNLRFDLDEIYHFPGVADSHQISEDGNTNKVGIFISNISEGRNVSWLFETFAFEIALSHADAFRLSGARFCTRPGSMSLRYPSSMTLPVVPENKSDSRNAGGVAILQMDEKGLLH